MPGLSTGNQFLSIYKNQMRDKHRLHRILKCFKHSSHRGVALQIPDHLRDAYDVFGRGARRVHIPVEDRTLGVVVIDLVVDKFPYSVEINPWFKNLHVVMDEISVTHKYYDSNFNNGPGQRTGGWTQQPGFKAHVSASTRAIKALMASIPKYEGKGDRMPLGMAPLDIDRITLNLVRDQLQDPQVKHIFNLFMEGFPT